MFEKFKFKDALIGLWKSRWILVAVAILTAMGVVFARISKVNKKEMIDDRYLTTLSFYVSPNFSISDNVDGKAEAVNMIALSYLSMISSDACVQHVYDKLVSEVSKEDLIKILKLDYTSNNLDKSFLKSITKVVKDKNSALVINVYIETYDKTISNKIVDGYKDFVKKEISNKSNGLVSITHLGTTQVLSEGKTLDSISADTDADKIVKPASTSLFKQLIIWEFLMLALAVICVFTKVLFMPTINSREDFAQYDVPVVTEIYGFSGCDVRGKEHANV